jgi:hypothetical protein
MWLLADSTAHLWYFWGVAQEDCKVEDLQSGSDNIDAENEVCFFSHRREAIQRPDQGSKKRDNVRVARKSLSVLLLVYVPERAPAKLGRPTSDNVAL